MGGIGDGIFRPFFFHVFGSNETICGYVYVNFKRILLNFFCWKIIERCFDYWIVYLLVLN